MARGKVNGFNDAKAYGFIEQDSGEDVFVHFSAISMDGFKTLAEGQEVEFEIHSGEKGLHAANVNRVYPPPQAPCPAPPAIRRAVSFPDVPQTRRASRLRGRRQGATFRHG